MKVEEEREGKANEGARKEKGKDGGRYKVQKKRHQIPKEEERRASEGAIRSEIDKNGGENAKEEASEGSKRMHEKRKNPPTNLQ